jgi:hypothetical protein
LPNRRSRIEMGPFIDNDRFRLRRFDFLVFLLCHFFNQNFIVVLATLIFDFWYWLLDGNLFSLLSKLIDRE